MFTREKKITKLKNNWEIYVFFIKTLLINIIYLFQSKYVYLKIFLKIVL